MTKNEAVEDVYPLTPLQEGLLFHSVYSPGSGQYHDQFSAVLRGPLRPETLAEAWSAVVAATPVLRTAFSWQSGGAPRQVVVRRAVSPLRLEDWRPIPPAERAARRAAFLEEDLRRGFDLARAPLTRAALCRLSDDAWFLAWSRHHLLLDGWSVSLVLRAWLGAYAGLCEGRHPSFPSVRPFREFVEWVRRRDESRDRDFWTAELGDLEEPAAAPFDRPAASDPPAGAPRHGEIDLALGAGESEALRNLARSARVTPATVFQAAWGLLLAKLSGSREAVFGHTVSGRPADFPGAEGMVGLFINTVPLRLRLRPEAPLADWLRSVQARASAAREFEHAPLVRIHGWSGAPRDRPLFEALLVVENYPAGGGLAASLGSIQVEEARSHERTHYPATLIVSPGDRIGLRLLHDRGRLPDPQAARWMDGLVALLGAMASGAGRPVGGLGILPPAEREKILLAWNATGRERDREATLPGLVAAQAARTAGAVAVDDGRERLTYAELLRRARALARRLRAAGAGPERCVGVCLERSADLVVALLGVLESGAAYVPLDPAYPADRLAFMAGDARLAALVTRRGLEGRVPAPGVEPVWIDSAEAAGPEPRPPLPSNLAYLIYTSGSTGRPKAAAIEHRQAAALVHWALSTFSARELSGVLFSTSVCFDLSVFELFATLASGGTVIVAENALALPAHPSRGAVTLVNTVPSAAAELARQEALPPSVVAVCLAGEPLSAALSDRLYAFPHVERVCDLYGPSEDTTYSTFAQRARGGPATIGRVIDNSRLYLLDDDLQPVPVGAAGEIHLAGEGLARGYYGRPDLTAERFIPDPFSPHPGGRLYRTGDLARFREDGQLEFLGRRDHQVKIRGFRIELGEIQARLEAHPGVAEAAVLARDHPARGKYLAAFAAAKPGATLGPDTLAAWVRESLPLHMLPSAWRILPRLPRTPNGKLDRRALPADAILPGGPAETAPRPSDPAQEIVAGIWAEVLGVGSVRATDDFFELGGHSLLATQAIARVRLGLGAAVPLAALFEHPTLAAFAAEVRSRRLGDAGASEEAVAPRPAGSAPPLSFAQERLWALARLSPESAAYHVPAALEAEGDLDPAALSRALDAVAARHEALRMSFPEEDGLARVAVADEIRVPLAIDDLQALPEKERPAAARRIAAEEGRRPFDLGRGPLVRARLVRLGPRRHWLLLTAHHIVTDGWSESILARELAALHAGGEPDEPPVGYGDYARWQRERFRRGEWARQVSWWTEELRGIPPLELPLDAPRPHAPTHRGGAVKARVDLIEAERLRAVARSRGATLFMTLLAAWETWLSRRSGQADFGIGVPVAGRLRREVEGVVGLFVNTVVIRSDVSAGIAFADLVKKVRERALGAYDRQEAPFEQVIEAVRPGRDPRRSPLFQVMFVFQNTPPARLELGGLSLSPVEIGTLGSKFELTLVAAEERDGAIGLTLEYDRDLFGETTAAGFLADFGKLLASAGSSPDGPLEELGGEPGRPLAGRAAPPAPPAPTEEKAAFAAPEGPVEALLAGIWGELLQAKRVGRRDNFFSLGGDSIVALQVSARAAAAGVRVPPQAVFDHQTLAELAAAALASGGAPAARGSRVGEEVPLTPIQRWFFEQDFARPAHWNQSILIATPADFDPGRFESALRDAASRHDSLHLRFSRGANGWAARRGEPGPSVAFDRAPPDEGPRAAARAQAGLDLERGPLLRAVHVAPSAAGEGRLLLAAHHLAIDVVSWRVLLEELGRAYSGTPGAAAASPRGSADGEWSAWARALQAEAARDATLAELAHWRSVPAGPPLPRDFSAPGRGIAAEEAVVETSFPADETEAILRGAEGGAGARMAELLLAALARALENWTGSPGHTVALEGHGREAFPGSPPVERALGWFTTLFPLRIELPKSRDPAAALQSVREQVRAVPRRGFGYGLLRHLGPPEARAALGAQPWPELCFNYLGQLDAPAPAEGFRVSAEPRGPDHGAENGRPFLLDVNAAVRDGRLSCAWTYGAAHHRRDTIQRLADRFAAEVRALLAAGSAAPASPSDFSASGLSQADLDKVLSRQR